MKRMTAKFPGTCHACRNRFSTGTLIDFNKSAGRGRKTRHVDCASPGAAVAVEIEEGAPGHGPGCYGECDGLYDCNAPAPEPTNYRTVSYEVRTSGGTFYRNRNGRCEDAPCCGCCTF